MGKQSRVPTVGDRNLTAGVGAYLAGHLHNPVTEIDQRHAGCPAPYHDQSQCMSDATCPLILCILTVPPDSASRATICLTTSPTRILQRPESIRQRMFRISNIQRIVIRI